MSDLTHLSADDFESMRFRLQSRIATYESLAVEYGIDTSTVRRIMRIQPDIPIRRDVVQKFVSKLSTPEHLAAHLESPCWPWKGATNGIYGRIRIDGTIYLAHRVAFAIFRGSIPEGRYVLHECDVPLCCRPSHLRAGTPAENAQDNAVRNANARRFSPDDIRKIRSSYAAGRATQSELSLRYSVSQFCISQIVRRITYRDVT